MPRSGRASPRRWRRSLDLDVVGQAGSLAEAREILAAEHGFDVAVIDLGLPDGFGAELIGDLRAANPRAQALVLSATDDRAEIARAVELGAAGLLHKSAAWARSWTRSGGFVRAKP